MPAPERSVCIGKFNHAHRLARYWDALTGHDRFLRSKQKTARCRKDHVHKYYYQEELL